MGPVYIGDQHLPGGAPLAMVIGMGPMELIILIEATAAPTTPWVWELVNRSSNISKASAAPPAPDESLSLSSGSSIIGCKKHVKDSFQISVACSMLGSPHDVNIVPWKKYITQNLYKWDWGREGKRSGENSDIFTLTCT